jgi:hypothetical protein
MGLFPKGKSGRDLHLAQTIKNAWSQVFTAWFLNKHRESFKLQFNGVG